MSENVKHSRYAEILLVEDNENDVELARWGLKEAALPVNLHHVETGEACMAFLRKQGQYAAAPTPDLILLDLNLPVMDGRHVLMELVADAGLCHLPVIVLTTSADEQDILKMYQLRCSSYIVKPIDFDQFVRVIRSISDYWFTIVVLPNNAANRL